MLRPTAPAVLRRLAASRRYHAGPGCSRACIVTAPKSDREKAQRVIAENRKARHDYHILETWEAGVALLGTEVKSIREGRVNLRDSYAQVDRGEVWMRNVHISPYSHRGSSDHEELRQRALARQQTATAGAATSTGITRPTSTTADHRGTATDHAPSPRDEPSAARDVEGRCSVIRARVSEAAATSCGRGDPCQPNAAGCRQRGESVAMRTGAATTGMRTVTARDVSLESPVQGAGENRRLIGALAWVAPAADPGRAYRACRSRARPPRPAGRAPPGRPLPSAEISRAARAAAPPPAAGPRAARSRAGGSAGCPPPRSHGVMDAPP